MQTEHDGAKLRNTRCQSSRWRDGASHYWPCHRHRNMLNQICSTMFLQCNCSFFHALSRATLLRALMFPFSKLSRTNAAKRRERHRRVALPVVEELRSQLWTTQNIFLCCSPSRAEDGDSAQRAVSKVLECQAEKRGREEPKLKSRNRRRLTSRPKAKAHQHWKLFLGNRRWTQQRMCSIFHCLAKRTLQSSCNSLQMAYSSDCR